MDFVEAIADGLRAPDLQRKLEELVNRRTVLERPLGSAPSPAPQMHPALAETYRHRVMGLQTALRGPDGTQALEAAPDLIERVALHPSADGSGREIELAGAIAAMVELAMDGTPRGASRRSRSDSALFNRSVRLVAGAGFEPAAFRL
jgi:site-specific DNA recombinase